MQRQLASTLAILLVAGCAGMQQQNAAPRVLINLAPPAPLGGDDNGNTAKELPGQPTNTTKLDDLLGNKGNSHKSQDGLDNVRVWPGTTGTTNGVGPHETAKFFFQQIIKAAENTNPGAAYETVQQSISETYNGLVCTVRFDTTQNPDGTPTSIKDSNFARLVYVSYRENRRTGMAWIEYARRDHLDPTSPTHRHRIIFVERDSFTSTHATDYYGYATNPEAGPNGNGLICPAAAAGPLKPFDDGGGGGEM
jgi:hypothetical protein